MQAAAFRRELRVVTYTAQMNALYQQRVAWWWWVGDKITKVAVGVLAALALAAAIFGDHTLDVIAASLALVPAIILNVIPLGEKEAEYKHLFRAWTGLHRDSDKLSLKVANLGDDAKVPEHLVEQLGEALSRLHDIGAEEPAPWEWLIVKCQEEINEREWGKGIRTYQQVEAERQRRLGSMASMEDEAGPAPAP